MKYQVRRAGGDTLLLGGPIGDAYDCSRSSATAAAPEPAPTTRPTPTPTSTPSTPPPPPPAATPPPKSGVRIVLSRELAKGCVYLGDVDMKLACPDEPGKTSEACASDRAIEAGGNTVFLDGGRAQIFSCEPTP
jgi:hypothetical protein